MNNSSLLLHNSTLFRFEDLVDINDEYNISDLLLGACHIFTYAMAEILGDKATYGFRLIYDNEKPHLAHAYIKINNSYVDARGIFTEDELDEYTIDSINVKEFEMSASEYITNCKDSNWGVMPEKLLNDITQFILQYEDLYNGIAPTNQLFLKYKEYIDPDDIAFIENNHIFSL